MKNIVCMQAVSKFIMSDVSFHVPQGEIVGIVGESGAGKTTLLKLICGLLRPEKGLVGTLGKEPVKNRKKLGRYMTAFFTEIPVLQGELTVREELDNRRILYGISTWAYERDYQELAEKLDFAAYECEKVKNLSMGQRRRVELAAVLLPRPALYLLDEPTNGLDENGKAAFYKLIAKRREEGATVLLASHDMTEINALCSRILLLDRGMVAYYGSETLLLKKYAPLNTMEIILQERSRLPDMEDIPLEKYSICDHKLTLIYNANHISTAEILDVLMKQIAIKEINIQRQSLTTVLQRLTCERESV